jgi:hypothetical protein
MKKPVAVYLLVVLHIFLGISAIAGGALLIVKTDGTLLGMEPGWLSGSPFSNYLIPGIFLFVVNGAFPLLVAAGLLFKAALKWMNRFNIYKQQHWAWTCSLFTGIIVIGWIIIQQFMTAYFWLQPCIATVGLLIIICTMLPAVMNYYQNEKN